MENLPRNCTIKLCEGKKSKFWSSKQSQTWESFPELNWIMINLDSIWKPMCYCTVIISSSTHSFSNPEHSAWLLSLTPSLYQFSVQSWLRAPHSPSAPSQLIKLLLALFPWLLNVVAWFLHLSNNFTAQIKTLCMDSSPTVRQTWNYITGDQNQVFFMTEKRTYE